MWPRQGIMFRMFYHLHKEYNAWGKAKVQIVQWMTTEEIRKNITYFFVVHMDFNHSCIAFSYLEKILTQVPG